MAADEAIAEDGRVVWIEFKGVCDGAPVVVGAPKADDRVDCDKPRVESCALVGLEDNIIVVEDCSDTGLVAGTVVT